MILFFPVEWLSISLRELSKISISFFLIFFKLKFLIIIPFKLFEIRYDNLKPKISFKNKKIKMEDLNPQKRVEFLKTRIKEAFSLFIDETTGLLPRE